MSARPKKPRAEFAGGFWFALSAGRRQNADPRWLLPLICRVGHITKDDVGAIKIFDTETRFEISAAAAERYAEALLRNGTGEKSITIVRLEPGTPEPAEPKGRTAGPEGYRKPAGKRDWQKSGKPKPYARKSAGAEKPRG